jgi:hypothetical protein
VSDFTWQVSPEQAFIPGYEAYLKRLEAALYALANFYAPQIEAWMKENAGWTDRTGNARAGLHTEVQQMVGQIVILLAHGVNYGQWLEYRNAGRYAVINPALDYWGPIVMDAVRRLLK